MFKKFTIFSLVAVAVIATVGFAVPAAAQTQAIEVGAVEKSAGGILWTDINDCRERGDCKIGDFVQLAVNISSFILAIVGSLALLMFVYGGVVWIISAGSAEKVQQGKTIVRNAVIGLVLVFTSWLIVSVVVRAFSCGGENAETEACTSGTIFNQSWSQVP
jgi:hypothetical protein